MPDTSYHQSMYNFIPWHNRSTSIRSPLDFFLFDPYPCTRIFPSAYQIEMVVQPIHLHVSCVLDSDDEQASFRASTTNKLLGMAFRLINVHARRKQHTHSITVPPSPFFSHSLRLHRTCLSRV